MTDRVNEHTLIFTCDKGWTGWRLLCGWQASDPERPCWSHTEYGERYSQEDGERAGCVYADWVSEMYDEAFTDFTMEFDLDAAHWTGDCFEFTVGQLLRQTGENV